MKERILCVSQYAMDRKIHCTENLCEESPHAHEVQNFHLLLSNRDIN